MHTIEGEGDILSKNFPTSSIVMNAADGELLYSDSPPSQAQNSIENTYHPSRNR